MTAESLIIAAAALTGLVVVAASLLKAWQGWLKFKRLELEHRSQAEPFGGMGGGTGIARIEMADLKERIRKLEAIASGVDL